MQTIVDDALDITEKEGHAVKHVAVLDHKLAAKRSDVPWKEGRDIWWQDVMDALPSDCPVEWVDAEAPLFKVAFGSLQATFAFLSLNMQRAFCHLHANCSMCTRGCCLVAASASPVVVHVTNCLFLVLA